MDPIVAHELALAPLGHWPEAPEKHCLRQLPMNEKVFVEIQVFRGKVAAHYWSKKTLIWTH